MFKLTKPFCLFIFFVFVFGFFSLTRAAEETLTITTYYPSPYGSYNDLYVANKLGIGTTSPVAKLDISGGTFHAGSGTGSASYNSIGAISGMDDSLSSSSDLYIEGKLEVDGTMYLTGGYNAIQNSDIAENLLTEKGRNNVLCEGKAGCIVEPYNKTELDYGDVVCINPKVGQTIMKCKEPNSRLAVGVVSDTAVLKMGNNGKYGYPIAVAGLVSTKVTNENGNINPGDLLVSASKSGYAMKNNKPKDGTVIGKAFDFCDKLEDKILMFVALN